MSDGREVDEIAQTLGRTGAAMLSAALITARIAMQRRAFAIGQTPRAGADRTAQLLRRAPEHRRGRRRGQPHHLVRRNLYDAYKVTQDHFTHPSADVAENGADGTEPVEPASRAGAEQPTTAQTPPAPARSTTRTASPAGRSIRAGHGCPGWLASVSPQLPLRASTAAVNAAAPPRPAAAGPARPATNNSTAEAETRPAQAPEAEAITMPHGEITRTEMALHLTAGDARPLVSGGIPGPMRLAGRWWTVPAGAEHYHPVTGPVAERLDEHARRLAAAAAAADRAHSRTTGPAGNPTPR